MLAALYFIAYAFCGTVIAFALLPRMRVTARVWLGLSLGLALEMWLPALCAFFFDFTIKAHLWALLLLSVLTVAAYFGRRRVLPVRFSAKDKQSVSLLICVALPLTLIGAYLQWTHNIAPAADGTLHVGQSTYGDLPLHLSIITSLRNAPFPPDYAILPGALLTYPFLGDSLSTTFMLLGCDLRAAVLIPGIYMTALVFCGYVLFACRVAEKKGAAALAALLFFVNGGLGFLYLVDMQGMILGREGSNELQSVPGLMNRIRLVLDGWYQTPANHAEFTTYNLRWSNVIVDMMVPQRTTLAGWSQVIPCMYLLYDALRPEGEMTAGIHLLKRPDGPTAVMVRRKIKYQQMVVLGLWAGMLPMINTHCFLALGLMSLGWMGYDLIKSRRHIGRALVNWLIYGGLAVAVAAPQLLTWTFRQAVGNSGFLRFQFNWVNGNQGMLDGYFWFYIKNIGLPFILLLLSLLEKNDKRRFLASGAFAIFIVAEWIVFQPNEYDNNKLFYIWYMICALLAADYAMELFDRLKGLASRPVIAALCLICFFATGTLSIAREMGSDYQMFGSEDVEATAFVEENTERDALFLTGTQHINFVSSLAGRRIICGPDTWLVYHGFNTYERKQDIKDFYGDPLAHLDVLEKYGVDYILISPNESYDYTIDYNAFETAFEKVYESDWENIRIYAAPEA